MPNIYGLREEMLNIFMQNPLKAGFTLFVSANMRGKPAAQCWERGIAAIAKTKVRKHVAMCTYIYTRATRGQRETRTGEIYIWSEQHQDRTKKRDEPASRTRSKDCTEKAEDPSRFVDERLQLVLWMRRCRAVYVASLESRNRSVYTRRKRGTRGREALGCKMYIYLGRTCNFPESQSLACLAYGIQHAALYSLPLSLSVKC